MSGNTLKVETDERVLLSTEKQENKDGKIRTFLNNLSFLSQVVFVFFLQRGSTRFVWDCGKYRSLRASNRAQGKARGPKLPCKLPLQLS